MSEQMWRTEPPCCPTRWTWQCQPPLPCPGLDSGPADVTERLGLRDGCTCEAADTDAAPLEANQFGRRTNGRRYFIKHCRGTHVCVCTVHRERVCVCVCESVCEFLFRFMVNSVVGFTRKTLSHCVISHYSARLKLLAKEETFRFGFLVAS